MSHFTIPAGSPEAHALEQLLPGDEMEIDMGHEILHLRCRQVTPNGMTEGSEMTWTKGFEIISVTPKEAADDS
jgi:hypothetical protein